MTDGPVNDLLIAGATLIDPAQQLHARKDVAFRDGLVVAVGDDLPVGGAREVLHAAGRIVTPGLVDVHGHFFHGYTTVPAVADEVCLAAGVTTAADAGTAGYVTFPVMRDYVFPTQRTTLKAWISIVATGYAMSRVLGTEFGDPRVLDGESLVEMIAANRGSAIGVKLRLGVDLQTAPQARVALERATAAARAGGVALMVHVFHSPIPLDEVLGSLAPGDVLTHAFHAAPGGILDGNGRLLESVRTAADNGVLLDLGFAGGLLCDLDVLRAAIEQGLPPHTLGTDMGHPDVVPVPFYGVDELVNLCVALGMDLGHAVASATWRPAGALGLSSSVGALRPGMAGDVAIFRAREGRFRWLGVGGQTASGNSRLELESTIKAGRVVWRAGDPSRLPQAERVSFDEPT
jgi:dihydroorotase